MGMLIAVAGRSAQAEAQGSYSDRPLSPGSVPTGTLGTDLLLAENCTGPHDLHGTPIPAESWTTSLQIWTPNGSGGWNLAVTMPKTASSGSPAFPASGVIWAGSGPTGLYAAGTAATHTENTNADVAHFMTPTGKQYQYVIHDVSYNPTTGVSTSTDVSLGQRTCP